MKILMVGVDKSTKGGMWSVVENYLDNQDFLEGNELKYIPTSISGNFIKRIIFSIYSIIKAFIYTIFNNYDILHVHVSEKGSVFRKNIIMNISKIRNAKIIIHMHGAEFEKWYKSLNTKRQTKVKKILNKGDIILILGKYWENFVGSLLENKSKLKVLYNAINIPNINCYDNNTNNILFLGAVGKRKGIYDLLEAMKKIKNEKLCKCNLIIYGPDTTNQIEQIIKDYEVDDIVKYKGWLNNEEKKKVFRDVAINILPSYNEGLPMTILETMSYGIPNISTNVAAIPEIIDDSCGILVDPGDVNRIVQAITMLISDPNLRIEMSNNSYNKVKQYCSIEKHKNDIFEIYKNVLNEDKK